MSILPTRKRPARPPVPASRSWQSSRQAPAEESAPAPAMRRNQAVAQRVTRTRPAPVAKAAPAPRAQPARTIASNYAVDYQLVVVLVILLALGLVEVFSGSLLRAQTEFDQPAYFFIRQVAWAILGTGALVVMAHIPYQTWQRLAIPIMAVALILLVAVLVFGSKKLGAQRTLAGGSIQPSEITKLAVVIYVAAWVASKKDRLVEVQGGLIPFAVLMGLVAGLVVLQNSYSVMLIILVTGITMFFVGGGSIKQLAFAGVIVSVVLVMLVWTSDYRLKRVNTWLDAVSDPSKASYDVAQAKEMLSQGGGIDTSPENFMDRANAPLLWSDYMFANVGADLGFPGTLGVVVLFAALGYRGLTIALNAPDQFAGLSAIGITTWILTQAMIHMGASLVLIPTTGVPLPFMSYGGSALVSCMAAMGFLLSISRAIPEKRAPYEAFGFGWWNWRTRIPNSGRTQRSATKRRR